MNAHALPAAISYVFAILVLTVYGVEVCSYIDGLGYTGSLPVFVVSFAAIFVARGALGRTRSPIQTFRWE